MAVDTVKVVAPPKEAIPVPESRAPLRLGGWDHVAFSVPDLVEAERWYVDVLGAEIVGRWSWGGDTEFRGPPHEDVRIGSNVISLFLGDPIGPSNTPRMFHYAFNCRDMEEMDKWQAHLASKGVDLRGPIAHPGFGAVSIYFNDPWGTKLEITTWLSDFDTAVVEVTKRGGGIMGKDGARPPY